MKSFTIGEAGRLLRVRIHVIRYWEKEIPLVQPGKDPGGRKRYSHRDMQILLRLKYLLYDRRFTLEGAREQLYREMAGDHQDLRGRIAALRSELMDLYCMINNPALKGGVLDPSARIKDGSEGNGADAGADR
jgi:DNA-binding transcriptional MerR regulator